MNMDKDAELLAAARVAGSVPDQSGFWAELEERMAIRDQETKNLVSPRRSDEKSRTV